MPKFSEGYCSSVLAIYVTIFGKIDHLYASTKIHFLSVRENYIHALFRNTKCLTIDGQVRFYRWPFADTVEPQGCIFGINRTAWGTKLLLKVVLSSPVDCISSCQILKAQHCSLHPNGCFNPPLASHLPPPPTLPTPQ